MLRLTRTFYFRALLFCIGICILPTALWAKKHRQTFIPPKAILVQLSTESNRLQHFASAKSQRSVAMLLEDNKAVTDRTVMDFTDNFYYCPVYFFMDIDAPKIKAGLFEGTLLDKDLKPAQNIVLHPGDTNFFIGYFGPRASDFNADQQASEEAYMHHNDLDSGTPRWVVLDYQFHSLRAPLPSGLDPDIRKVQGHTSKQPASAYVYNSKNFNIAYAPSALLYSATLERFYRKSGKKRK